MFNNIKTDKPIVVIGTTVALDNVVMEWTKNAQNLEKRGIVVYFKQRRAVRILSALYNYYRKMSR